MKKVLSVVLVTFFVCMSVFGYVNPGYVSPITNVVKATAESVVKIDVEKTSSYSTDPLFDDFFRRFFGEELTPRFDSNRKETSIGSGFIFDEEGHVLTNYHVVKGAESIKITFLDGTGYDAEYIGGDQDTDIAILKIKEIDGKEIPYLELGDSDNLEIGEPAIAIGNPLGFQHTVTSGVISATNRKITIPNGDGTSNYYSDLIQTDAAINPGNSGGPLLNIHGEVIGINTAIINPTEGVNLGFAIPINKVHNLLDELIKYGKIKKAYLGVKIIDITEDTKEALGLDSTDGSIVVEVEPDSPAEKSGLHPQDIIIEIDGRKVEGNDHLISIIRSKRAGQEMKLKIDRNGEIIDLEVMLEQKEEDSQEIQLPEVKDVKGVGSQLMGFSVADLTPELRMKYSVPDSVNGVLITDVDESGSAKKLGLKTGSVLISINRKAVKSVEDWQNAIKDFKKGDFVALYVYTPGQGSMMLSFPIQ